MESVKIKEKQEMRERKHQMEIKSMKMKSEVRSRKEEKKLQKFLFLQDPRGNFATKRGEYCTNVDKLFTAGGKTLH